MDKNNKTAKRQQSGAFVAKKKQTGGSCLFAQNLRELGKLTNPSFRKCVNFLEKFCLNLQNSKTRKTVE